MELRSLGTTGLQVGRLGLGTMTWGRGTELDDAVDHLRAFVSAGGTLVDTAPGSVEGSGEEMLGAVLERCGLRAEIAISAKVGATRDPRRPGNASRRSLVQALDRSLRALRTDHVDLWQVQAWDAHTPWEETLSAMAVAVSSGRVRYVGVSNVAGWQLAHAATLARARDAALPIATAQVEYSLLQRGIEREVVPAARALGTGILPWAPLGRGVLTGKYRHGTPPDSRGASAGLGPSVREYLTEQSRRVVDAVSMAAEGLGVSPAEVALAWVRDRPGVVCPIVGARTRQHLATALSSEDLDLPQEIRSALDDVSRPVLGYPERGWHQRPADPDEVAGT